MEPRHTYTANIYLLNNFILMIKFDKKTEILDNFLRQNLVGLDQNHAVCGSYIKSKIPFWTYILVLISSYIIFLIFIEIYIYIYIYIYIFGGKRSYSYVPWRSNYTVDDNMSHMYSKSLIFSCQALRKSPQRKFSPACSKFIYFFTG